MTREVRIQPDGFDPWADIQQIEQRLPRGKFGAGAVFIGYMRDFNDNVEIREMVLEHYPGMTERHIERIADAAALRWELLHVAVVHRVGHVNISDPIVLVAVWSAHRAAAFDACRFIINDLKSQAPFWKREQTDNGERWVAHNNPDQST